MFKGMFSGIKQKFSKLGKSTKRKVVTLVTTVCVVVGSAVASFAATGIVDYTGATTNITTELTNALGSAVPIGGTILAAMVGWRLFKRFTK